MKIYFSIAVATAWMLPVSEAVKWAVSGALDDKARFYGTFEYDCITKETSDVTVAVMGGNTTAFPPVTYTRVFVDSVFTIGALSAPEPGTDRVRMLQLRSGPLPCKGGRVYVDGDDLDQHKVEYYSGGVFGDPMRTIDWMSFWSMDTLSNMEVVMRSHDRIPEMDEGEFPTYHNGRCTVRFPRTGNLATQNGFNNPNGWDANSNSVCQNSSHDIIYKLQSDGNLVVQCGDTVDYATHTSQGQTGGDYVLLIDGECILHLYEGKFDCNGVELENELWTNIRKVALGPGDRLGKGEYVAWRGRRLILQPEDGNLVLYGQSYEVLWAANNEWDSPPTTRDYFAHVRPDGHLVLVGVDLETGEEIPYFDKDLDSGGKDCFVVEYLPTLQDLRAVQCSI